MRIVFQNKGVIWAFLLCKCRSYRLDSAYRENTWCLSWNHFCKIMLFSFIHFPSDFLFLCNWTNQMLSCVHTTLPFSTHLWVGLEATSVSWLLWLLQQSTDRQISHSALNSVPTTSRYHGLLSAALRSSFCSVDCFQCLNTFYPMKQEDSVWLGSSSKCLTHFCFMSAEALPYVVSTMYASYFPVAL